MFLANGGPPVLTPVINTGFESAAFPLCGAPAISPRGASILPGREWYLKGDEFGLNLNGWSKRLRDAVIRAFNPELRSRPERQSYDLPGHTWEVGCQASTNR
jgi:hypothetical protein